MGTINVTNFSPMIEVNVKVFLQLPPNLDATASADDLEKVAANFVASHCAQAQEEKAPHTPFKVVRDEVKEKVETILSENVVEKTADEQVEVPNDEPSQEEKAESAKAAIVGGNWTIDPQVVVQLLDGETLKQVLVKALTS